MPHMFIFGLGYTASRLAVALRERGWSVDATGRQGNCRFDDRKQVSDALARATHILSSVPPDRSTGADPVLQNYGAELSGQVREGLWLGYLSSTGVYGDQGGAWVDEATPVDPGRSPRATADAAWLKQRASVFRLPGIYGPGRSALDRVREGTMRRIDLPSQVFSRVHVDDIVAAILAALETDAPPGPYNIADDLPTSANLPVEEACRLLGRAAPPLQTLEEANLTPMARGFYAENRRVANGKAKRILGWRPRYPTFVEALRAILAASGTATGTERALSATTMPSKASTPPAIASGDQR